jgi:hypothetical protein
MRSERREPDLVIDDEGECPMHEGAAASFRKPMVWHAERA